MITMTLKQINIKLVDKDAEYVETNRKKTSMFLFGNEDKLDRTHYVLLLINKVKELEGKVQLLEIALGAHRED